MAVEVFAKDVPYSHCDFHPQNTFWYIGTFRNKPIAVFERVDQMDVYCVFSEDIEDARKRMSVKKTKKSGWINIYKTNINRNCGLTIWPTEKQALDNSAGGIATVKIEWEE